MEDNAEPTESLTTPPEEPTKEPAPAPAPPPPETPEPRKVKTEVLPPATKASEGHGAGFLLLAVIIGAGVAWFLDGLMGEGKGK